MGNPRLRILSDFEPCWAFPQPSKWEPCGNMWLSTLQCGYWLEVDAGRSKLTVRGARVF